MLIQFSFGNFRSFRDKVTLDLTASPRICPNAERDAGNVVNMGASGDLLRVAAIYGANASGKSNVVEALLEFSKAVFRSANTDFAYQTLPFYLNTDSPAKPTFYEIVFVLDAVQYRYGFEVQTGETPHIVSEWLYQAASSRETLLFERTGDRVTRGRRFTEGASLLHDGVLRRKEALFLSLLFQNGGKLSGRIVFYLTRRMNIVSGLNDTMLHSYTTECLKRQRFGEPVDRLMRLADTGIASMKLFEKEGDTLVGAIHKVFDATGAEYGIVPFSMLDYESDGTRKLFAFAGPIFDTLESGNVLVVDEMDARFHPNLTRALVQLFQSETTNPKNAQLIFVTHDTNLLDARFNRFRRDQIYFVEKDRHGASHLYSLAEFKGVREPDENEYLRGTYGAIPFLGGIDKLFGTENSEAEGDTDAA